MPVWKKIVTWLVYLACMSYTVYAFGNMHQIADFYWLTSIPTGIVSFLGTLYIVIVGLEKWFEVK